MPHVRQIRPAPAQQAGEAPSESYEPQHVVSNDNRRSRVVLNFRDLTTDTWCELSFKMIWDPAEESRSTQDFAVIGVEFLTEDGSSIDFSYVPGLTRTQIDPHSHFISGPDSFDPASALMHSGQVHCTFLIPSPAKHLLVTLRSWRNSHPFRIDHPVLIQKIDQDPRIGGENSGFSPLGDGSEAASCVHDVWRSTWRKLMSEPHWFSYAVIPDRRLFVRGQLINPSLESEGALVRIVFRDKDGEEVPPPYPETLFAPGIGAVIRIPAHRQARRFTLELVPPPQAATVELGFQAWREEAPVNLVLPLEVSLDDDLLLESLLGDDTLDASSFLSRVVERLGMGLPSGATVLARKAASPLLALLDSEALAAPFTPLLHLKAVQQGLASKSASEQVQFGAFPVWPVPDEPDWSEDPFRSPVWRMEFQSLSWLLPMAEASEPRGLERAVDLAVSWSRANPLGSSSDVLSVHPSSLTMRAEVLLQLLSLVIPPERKTDPDKLLTLFAEVVRHGFVLSEIVGQNVLPHSLSQLRTACALLVLSRALPRFPLASYWKTIALAGLRDAFDAMVGADGASVEQSQHHRLEVLSLGLILLSLLESMPEAPDLRGTLAPRIRDGIRIAIMVTDPAGMLPPFGDIPHGYHHAAWLRRLISGFGQSLMADGSITSELAYPEGTKKLISPEAGLIAVRHYERKPDWNYLCTSFSEQRHTQGHFDCTSFVYAAGGIRWINDAGGSSLHENGAVRQYLISSRAHNVAVPDGREQTAGRGWLQSAASVKGAHVFEIGTNVHGPSYAHRRIIVCLHDLQAIAVFDHFTTSERPVSFQSFLHFDPSITAAIVNPKLAVGFKGRSRLRIIPRAVLGSFTGTSLESGRNDHSSSMQGFASRGAGLIEPTNVLRYAFASQRIVCGGAILALDEAGLQAIAHILEEPAVREMLERAPAS